MRELHITHITMKHITMSPATCRRRLQDLTNWKVNQ